MPKIIAGMTRQQWYKRSTAIYDPLTQMPHCDTFSQLNRNIRNLMVGATRAEMDHAYNCLGDNGDQVGQRIMNTMYQEMKAAGVDTYGEIPIG